MKIKSIRIFVSLMAVVVFSMASIFSTGCGEKETVDETKTQLYVNNFDGGYGGRWLDNLIERFEESEKDNSYEEGKKGVEVLITPNKTAISKSDLIAGESDVYFTEYAYRLNELINENLLLDITAAVANEKLTEYGEEKTIKDKLFPNQENLISSDGKFYAVPHYANYDGIIYDIDLFENNNLYFAEDRSESNFILTKKQKKSAGPDGVSGTDDDGLPATYDEFFELCDYIVQKGFVPFVWNGTHREQYLEKFMSGLQADYEGYDQMMLNYTFKGMAENLVSGFNGQTPVIKAATEIKNSNGYDVFTQAGKYYSTLFLSRIVDNESYYDVQKVFSPAYSHTEAQSDFLYSSYLTGKDPIAMIIEGTFWEEEAYNFGVFDAMSRYTGAARSERRFGFMPYPKATDEEVYEGNRMTLIDTQFSVAFIGANVPEYKKELAVRFLRFCCTDESCAEFTSTTSTLKALNYKMTEPQKAECSHFGKSLYDIRQSDRVDVVYPFSDNSLYMDSLQTFYDMRYASVVNGSEKIYPLGALKDDGISAIDLFNGYRQYWEKDWATKYGKYFS